MTPLFEALARWPRRPFGTIVHLGAGDGTVLDDYAALAPARVWLVEGDADALVELQARARHHAWAQVRPAVVAPQAGRVDWHRYNLRSLNGPREPLGLLAFYPRLRALGSTPADAVALADLLAALPPRQADEGERLLVIDLPGQEEALLASLPQDLLQGFDGVLLRGCGVKGPGLGNPAEAAVRHLLGRCFRSTAAVDTEPLWPVHLLAYDHAAADQAAWQAKALALDEALAALRAEHQGLQDALAAEREQALSARASEASDWQARLAHVAQERDEQARLAAIGRAELDAVARERDEQAKLAVGRRAQMEAAFQERDQQTRLAAERQQQLDTLAQARDTLARERDELARQLAAAVRQAEAAAAEAAKGRVEHEAAAKRQAEQLAGLTQELAEARQTASLSVRLQMLREADLRELQSRYQAAQVQQQGQHELLTKLAQRLSLATQYFQQLSLEQQHDGLVEDQAARPQ